MKSLIYNPLAQLAAFSLFLCPSAKAAEQAPWESKHKDLQIRTEAFQASLRTTHIELVAKAEVENPELLPRLSLEPPEPRQVGYGLLPVIKKSNPAAQVMPVTPAKTIYSLKWLEEKINKQQARANQFPEKISSQASLETLVEEFESLLKAYRNIEDHLGYHNHWQRSVRKYPRFFQQRNRLLPLAQQLNDLVKTGDNPERVSQLRSEIVQVVAPFKAAEGITLQTEINDQTILNVNLCTDIEDQDFLGSFQSTVEEVFSQPTMDSETPLYVEIVWQAIAPSTLYSGSPPAPGAKINEAEHRTLFTDCPLVLTTGAKDTHALVGDRVALGTRPINARVLAHEFGHLLGFGDSYLRAYEGNLDDPYGVVLIEWTGLSNDLMGRPGEGLVSPAMIEALFSTYSCEKCN